MYWFLISVPNKSIYTQATKLFIDSLNKQTHFDFNKFYVVSPTLVKQRLDNLLLNTQSK